MFGSIGPGFLAMNPVGDEQGLQPRPLGALDVGQEPVAHRQGAFRILSAGDFRRQGRGGQRQS